MSKKRRAYLDEAEKDLLELCEKIHVDGQAVIKSIVKDYLHMETYLEGNRRFKKSEIISLSLYQSLMNNGFRRTLKDICSKSRVSLKRIWKLQRYLDDEGWKCQSLVITPKDVIASKSGYLGLSFKDVKVMNAVVDKIRHFMADFSPHTIAGYIVYQYMRTWRKEAKMTKKHICSVLFITCMSVNRYQRYLRKQNISLGIL